MCFVLLEQQCIQHKMCTNLGEGNHQGVYCVVNSKLEQISWFIIYFFSLSMSILNPLQTEIRCSQSTSSLVLLFVPWRVKHRLNECNLQNVTLVYRLWHVQPIGVFLTTFEVDNSASIISVIISNHWVVICHLQFRFAIWFVITVCCGSFLIHTNILMVSVSVVLMVYGFVCYCAVSLSLTTGGSC